MRGSGFPNRIIIDVGLQLYFTNRDYSGTLEDEEE